MLIEISWTLNWSEHDDEGGWSRGQLTAPSVDEKQPGSREEGHGLHGLLLSYFVEQKILIFSLFQERAEMGEKLTSQPSVWLSLLKNT